MNKMFRSIKRQRGFTLVELGVVLSFLFWACVAGTVAYVVGHFIAKFW